MSDYCTLRFLRTQQHRQLSWLFEYAETRCQSVCKMMLVTNPRTNDHTEVIPTTIRINTCCPFPTKDPETNRPYITENT